MKSLLSSIPLCLTFALYPASVNAEATGQNMENPSKNASSCSILLRDFRTVKDGRVICYNIGTAAHAFGNLAVLQKYLPDAKVTVWADAPLSDSLARMMRLRFPKVSVVSGNLNNGIPSSPELAELVKHADLFLVSSGNGIASSVAQSLNDFQQFTGKPAAAYAIGCNSGILPLVKKLASASFRDSEALKIAERSENSRICWAPDAVFWFDCADEQFAENFLRKHALLPGNFVCCIPGYRATPRWEFFGGAASPKAEQLNREYAVHDQELLRSVIIHTVRVRKKKVLLCAEQIPEMALLSPLFYTLPEDVAKECTVLADFWNPAEALAVYRQSSAVFGIEMHSQVMALGNGVPAAIFRHHGFGTKSTMWKDIGVPEWLLEIDSPDSTAKACAIVDDLLGETAKPKVRKCRERLDRAAEKAIRMQFGSPNGGTVIADCNPG